MALTSADVYSQQTPGWGTVLGPGLGSLHVLQQENYRRQREAAAIARLKQQQEAADSRLIPDLKADGWLPHVDELNSAVKQGYDEIRTAFADPNKSAFEKKAFGMQKMAEIRSKADLSNELHKKRDQIAALGSDKDFDRAALSKAADDYFYKTNEAGVRAPRPLAELGDTQGLDDIPNNAALLNRNNVFKRIIDTNDAKESERIASAARQGGYGRALQATSNGFEVENGQIKRNADGSPVVKNPQYWLQVLRQDPRGRSILEYDAQQDKLRNEATVGNDPLNIMRNYGSLNPDQQAAVASAQRPMSDQERALRYFGGRFDATESNVQSYRAPARPAASGKKAAQIEEDDSSFATPGTYNATVDLPATGVGVQPGNTKVDVFNTNPGTTQEGFMHYGKAPAPKLTKKDGTRVDVEAKNLLPNGIYQEDGSGHFRYVPNNKIPLAGGYGEGFKMLVDSKTKRLRQLSPGENAQDLIQSGKAEYALHLNAYAHKNENYTADLSKLTQELMQEKKSTGEPKYSSPARAEIVAKEALEKGRSRKLVPYLENAVPIDNDTRTSKGRGYYKKFQEQIDAENARIRASGPVNQGGGIYKRPATQSTTTTAKPSRGGGIYKVK